MLRTRRIIEVDLKTPSRPPAFAFIEFDSSRAAEDAVAGRDSYDFHGERLRVRSTLITRNTSTWTASVFEGVWACLADYPCSWRALSLRS